MTHLFSPQGPRAPASALLIATFALACALGACGDAISPTSAGAPSGVAVSGQSAHFIVPSNEASKAFDSFSISFATYDAVAGAGGNALVTLAAPVALPGAATSCASAGCAYQVKGVPLAGAKTAVFAQLTPGATSSGAAYVPTATAVFNANQLLLAARSRNAQTAQGQALALSQDGLRQLGQLTGSSADELMRRGVCIGFVATSRDFAAGEIPGRSGALVSLQNAPQGAQLVYPDDSFLNVARQGTNARGAFLVVGGSTPPADGAGTAITVSVTAPGSDLLYSNQTVLVRPGLVTAMPMLPIR